MNPEDIQNGLIQACKTLCEARDLSPAQPNYAKDPVDGQVRFDFTDPVRENDLLKGGGVRQEIGRMVATICTKLGQGTETANGHASALAGVFPKGEVISITGGTITITEIPQIRRGYPDDAVWRVPVVIRYYAQAS